MKNVLVTQRVAIDPSTGERRDALDQRWHGFLLKCGLQAFPVPNHLPSARRLLSDHRFGGVLLTGGDDLEAHGGEVPERDEVELLLLRESLAHGVPLIGVCRGMQLVLSDFGVRHEPVDGHVAERQAIEIHGDQVEVNSFHRWGCREVPAEFAVWARAEDGVLKAVRHTEHALVGVMWHPERLQPTRAEDVELFRSVFGVVAP